MEKRGLGRGLNSLFGDYNLLEEDESKQKQPKEVKIVEEKIVKEIKVEPQEVEIGLVDRNPAQPRRNFDEKALNELAQSIKSHGIISPLIVVKKGDRYIIVAGERRWRAAIKAKLKKVPVIIKDYDEQQIAEIAIIENLQREDLNPIESARAIKELMDKYNMTQEKVADKIGKSRPAVANTLRLLTLPEQIIELILANKISAGHARALLAVEDKSTQKELAVRVVEKKISVRDLEKLIKKLNKEKFKAPNKQRSLELDAFEKDLTRILGTKTSIIGSDKKGRIIVNYYSAEDLQRIYDVLNK